ncbi:hypothetical protein C8R46DRAFT_1044254 [Mycena filopes]|nr:hypothetical protein C8R46DRAFT_1044254 [Mycena filopes]
MDLLQIDTEPPPQSPQILGVVQDSAQLTESGGEWIQRKDDGGFGLTVGFWLTVGLKQQYPEKGHMYRDGLSGRGAFFCGAIHDKGDVWTVFVEEEAGQESFSSGLTLFNAVCNDEVLSKARFGLTIFTWPLHKDDTLFRSGRPMGLKIYALLTKRMPKILRKLPEVQKDFWEHSLVTQDSDPPSRLYEEGYSHSNIGNHLLASETSRPATLPPSTGGSTKGEWSPKLPQALRWPLQQLFMDTKFRKIGRYWLPSDPSRSSEYIFGLIENSTTTSGGSGAGPSISALPLRTFGTWKYGRKILI